MSLVHYIIAVIAAPVAHLIKKSFEYTKVPTGFKKAVTIPLHKKNKKTQSCFII